MSNTLLVFGGNGFLGKRICQEGVLKGYKVVSLSRSGKVHTPTNIHDKAWMSEVQWKKCNIFEPETYLEHLAGGPNVVHSMGILLEDERYKKSVRGPVNQLMSKVLELKPLQIGSNPLEKTNPKFTYEWMNKRSAMILADALSNELKSLNRPPEEAPSFTYISADKGFPLIPSGYIDTKRQAEEYLLRPENMFRPIIMRPGFMYDEVESGGQARSIVQSALEILNCSNKLIFNKRFQFVNSQIRPTVSTQQVSKSVMKKVSDKTFSGIVKLEEITTV